MKQFKFAILGFVAGMIMLSACNPVAASPGVAKAQNVHIFKADVSPVISLNCTMEDQTVAVIKFSELYGPFYRDSLVARVAAADADPAIKKVQFVMDRKTVSKEIPYDLMTAFRNCSKPVETFNHTLTPIMAGCGLLASVGSRWLDIATKIPKFKKDMINNGFYTKRLDNRTNEG